MTYQPREFWEQRLREQFDLRGTGETGLSLAYNRACYTLRREVLERALGASGVTLTGASVLDVGCGTGFFTQFYLEHGARVTGLDITSASVEGLAARFPQARFVLADVSETPIDGAFDVVNVFDVFYHITDDARWEYALRNAANAVAPGGVLVYTDVFAPRGAEDPHNRTRPEERHRELLRAVGLEVVHMEATHFLLNHELGWWRFLNRFPGLLLALDRVVLANRWNRGRRNQLLIARKAARP